MLLRPGRKTTAETTTDVLYRVRILLIVNCREVRRRTTAELFWSAQWPATARCTAVSETVCLSIQTSKQIYEMRTEIPIPSPPHSLCFGRSSSPSTKSPISVSVSVSSWLSDCTAVHSCTVAVPQQSATLADERYDKH